MKITSSFVTILVAAYVLTSFPGCSKKKEESPDDHAAETASSSQISAEPDSKTDTPAPVEAKPAVQNKETDQEETETFVDLQDVLTSWNAGDKERATEQFLKVNWDHPEVFAKVQILNISQQDFMASSQAQQGQFMQDIKDLAAGLRKLGLHILSVGEASSASGDQVTSKKYYESVLQCGQSIASNDYYDLILLTAKGLIKASEDKLAQLEGSQENSGMAGENS